MLKSQFLGIHCKPFGARVLTNLKTSKNCRSRLGGVRTVEISFNESIKTVWGSGDFGYSEGDAKKYEIGLDSKCSTHLPHIARQRIRDTLDQGAARSTPTRSHTNLKLANAC